MIYLFIGALLLITAKSQDCTIDDDCSDPSTPFCYEDSWGILSCAPCSGVGNDTDCTDNPSYGPGSTCDEFFNGLFNFPYCTPPACTSNSDCDGSIFYPVCNEMDGSCANCVNDTDCMNNPYFGEGYTCQDSGTDIGYFCDNETMTTSGPLQPECSTDANCTYSFVAPYCDNTTYQCVTCRTDEDCVNHILYGTGSVCDEIIGIAFCKGGPCSTSADCAGSYPICADNTNTCAQCNDATDCDAEEICEYNPFIGNLCVNNGTETTTQIPETTTTETPTTTTTEGCSIDDDCSDPFAPICDVATSECIVCRNDTDCVNNFIFGDNTVCQDIAPGFVFKFCFGGPCVSDTDCGGNYYPVCGIDTDTCVQCNEADDCMENFGISGDCVNNFCVDSNTSTPTTTETPTTTQTPTTTTTEGCSIDDDCSDPFAPICDVATSECIVCRNDTDCVNNFIFGDNTVCQDIAPGLVFKFCFGGPCVSDTDCGGNYYPVCGTDTDTCVQCNEADDCMENFGFSGDCVDNFCVDSDTTTQIPDTTTTELPTTTETPTTTQTPTTTTTEGCSIDDDCGAGFFPICDISTSECIACRNDTDCVNNVIFGDNTVCQDFGFGFSFCLGGPCVSDTDCGSPWYTVCGIDSDTCVQCNEPADCDENLGTFDFTWNCTDNVCVSADSSTPTTTSQTTVCYSHDDCINEDPYHPICEYNECVACSGWNSTQCRANDLYGPQYECDFGECVIATTAGPETTEAPCSSSDECMDRDPYNPICSDDNKCVECGEASDCDQDIYGEDVACETKEVFFPGLGVVTVGPYCIPRQCESASDCDTDGAICKHYLAYGFFNATYCYDDPTIVCTEYGDECEGSAYPFCNATLGICVECIEDIDCGVGLMCNKDRESPYCEAAGCTNNTACDGSDRYPICDLDYGICAECYNGTGCDEGYECMEMYGEKICYMNTTYGFSTSFAPESCIEVGSECDSGDDEGICTEISIGGVTVKYCVPTDIKLCDDGDDCLTGQTCAPGLQGVSYCAAADYDTVCTVDPNDCDDGLTCYDASNNTNKDNFCYLSCTVETQDDDCDIDGYKCQSSDVNDVELLTCVYDASTVADPTPEPTEQPTAAPEDPNTSGVEQLGIFGGMIIMIVNSLFM